MMKLLIIVSSVLLDTNLYTLARLAELSILNQDYLKKFRRHFIIELKQKP